MMNNFTHILFLMYQYIGDFMFPFYMLGYLVSTMYIKLFTFPIMTAAQSPCLRALYQSGKRNNTTRIYFDSNMDSVLVSQLLSQTFRNIVVPGK